MSQQDTHLEKSLSLFGVWALALGAMIGWGCFVMPGDTLLPGRRSDRRFSWPHHWGRR